MLLIVVWTEKETSPFIVSAVTSGLEIIAVVCYCSNSIVPMFSYFLYMYGLVTYINNYTDIGTDYIFVLDFGNATIYMQVK